MLLPDFIIAVRFTVARQRLTRRNQIACQRVCECASAALIGSGGSGAVSWEHGGVWW